MCVCHTRTLLLTFDIPLTSTCHLAFPNGDNYFSTTVSPTPLPTLTSPGLYEKLETLAARRKLSDLTIGPVLTWTTEAMLAHVNSLLAIPGARLLFGGKELLGGAHTIPKVREFTGYSEGVILATSSAVCYDGKPAGLPTYILIIYLFSYTHAFFLHIRRFTEPLSQRLYSCHSPS